MDQAAGARARLVLYPIRATAGHVREGGAGLEEGRWQTSLGSTTPPQQDWGANKG